MLQDLSLQPGGEWTPDGDWAVVRVIAGAGYCLQHGAVREFNAGDMIIAGPHAAAVFRASQLGVLRVEFYLVLPQFLNGLLTFTESRQLEDSSGQAATGLLYFAASDATAQKFTRIAALPQPGGLLARASLFQLWAMSITPLLPQPGDTMAASDLRQRFRQIVGKKSALELASRSLPQLAEELHCSGRHFSRLFQEEFHVSLRDHQTELRLQCARQLLEQSDAKIINVAYESGYKHLGLFNLMFKRRFGGTPSQWRQKHRASAPQKAAPKKIFKRAANVMAVLFLLVTIIISATAARAQTNAPVPNKAATNAGPHFKVEKYLVDGNTVLAPGQAGPDLDKSAGGVRHERESGGHPRGAGGFADGVSRARVCNGVRRAATAEAHQRHGEDQGDGGPDR